MVVDDDPSIRSTVDIILKTSGYSICAVESGQGCLDRLREGFRGLILMDVMMPKMDGWDTIAAIEDEGLYKGNVICMLTAVHDPCPKPGKADRVRNGLREETIHFRRTFGSSDRVY